MRVGIHFYEGGTMTNNARSGDFVVDELGDDRKPTGRFVVKNSLGKVIGGPFNSALNAECHCRSQSQFDIDHMRQSNFDQDT